MISIVTNRNSDKRLIEKCLCVIRAMYLHTVSPIDMLYSDPNILLHILSE